MNDVKTDWDIETFVMPNELVFSSCLYRKLSKSRVLSGEFKMSMKLKTGGMYDYDVCVCVYIMLVLYPVICPPWKRCKNVFSINSCLETKRCFFVRPPMRWQKSLLARFFFSFVPFKYPPVWFTFIHQLVMYVCVSVFRFQFTVCFPLKMCLILLLFYNQTKSTFFLSSERAEERERERGRAVEIK